MCGRFAQVVKYKNLKKYLDELENTEQTIPINFNVAPTNNVGAILLQENKLSIDFLQWQLIPSWSKSLNSQYNIINTRVESIKQKPFWRGLFQHKRCLIPASGFYEWDKITKEPNYFIPENDEYLFFAAIYDTWHGSDGSYITSCSILTTDANADMENIHHRMPVIIQADMLSDYINSTDYNKLLNNIIRPISGQLKHYSVSKKVNNVRNNSSDLIKPYVIEDNLNIFSDL